MRRRGETNSAKIGLIDCKTKQTLGPIFRPEGVNFGGRKRVLASEEVNASYHLMSRVVGGEYLLGEEEKEALRKLIWKMARFLGLKIYTYCVMDNHFHVLVQAPARSSFLGKFKRRSSEYLPEPETILDAEGKETSVVDLAVWEHRLLKHLSTFYTQACIAKLTSEIQSMRMQGRESDIDLMLSRYLKRFCSVEHFMKEVKERFSRWYNKKHSRKGTLWMDRFKSVLVESGEALRVMAAYIDLNPVRSGICDDPAEYRWGGYAEAESGSRRAKWALCKLMGVPRDSWGEHAYLYRSYLFAQGVERVDPNGTVLRSGVNPRKLEKVKQPNPQDLEETQDVSVQESSRQSEAKALAQTTDAIAFLLYTPKGKNGFCEPFDLQTKIKAFTYGWVFGSLSFLQKYRL